jgi:hypothetical protein
VISVSEFQKVLKLSQVEPHRRRHGFCFRHDLFIGCAQLDPITLERCLACEAGSVGALEHRLACEEKISRKDAKAQRLRGEVQAKRGALEVRSTGIL